MDVNWPEIRLEIWTDGSIYSIQPRHFPGLKWKFQFWTSGESCHNLDVTIKADDDGIVQLFFSLNSGKWTIVEFGKFYNFDDAEFVFNEVTEGEFAAWGVWLTNP